MRLHDGKSIVVLSMAVLFLLFKAVPSHALLIKIDFTADTFLKGNSTLISAPDNKITGVVAYETNPITNSIEALTGINLAIGGHSYKLSEVGYLFLSAGTVLEIGALSNYGVNVLSSGTDDFFINFNWGPNNPNPIFFQYTSASAAGTWYSHSFPSFIVDPVDPVDPVPEPALLTLLGFGLIAFWGLRKKIRG
jgi:hypothetical protein